MYVSIIEPAVILVLSFGHGAWAEEAKTADAASQGTIQLTEEQQKSPLIHKVTAEMKAIDVTLNVIGTMASDPDRVTQFHPSASGRLTAVQVSIGDTVDKGQIIGQLEDGTQIKAGEGGTVLGIFAHPGDLIDPMMPFMTFANTSKMRCVFDVFEKEIGKIKKGQKVSLRIDAYPEEVFHGRVSYISPRVNENSRTVKVGAEIENLSGHLKFGMFANGKISINSKKTLVVPESAVQRVDGRPSVFAYLNDSTVAVKVVEVGDTYDGNVEIKSGLHAGESVVAEGSFILKSSL